MDDQFQKLVELFNSNTANAINESQRIICSNSNFETFQDFYTYHLKNAHMSTCQNEWSTNQLCIYCRDCAVSHPACICLSCFLNGNHEGHDYVILNTTGNCDCGDPEQWKKSGTCLKHRMIEEDDANPENYIDEKLRTILTDLIFRASFTSLKQQSTNNLQNASLILQFLSSFLNFGDGFRRLICRSLTEKIDFEGLMRGIPTYSGQFNQILQQFFGLLVNDQLFRENASIVSYSVLSDQIYKDLVHQITEDSPPVTFKVWNGFWFHFFSEFCIRFSIEKKKWDWVTFYAQIPIYCKEAFKYIGRSIFKEIPFLFTSAAIHLSNATKIQPNEETQRFFDLLINESLPCESVFSSFSMATQNYHYYPVYEFGFFASSLFRCFKNKPNLKIDCLFDELEKSVNLSQIFVAGRSPIGSGNGDENENDKFVSRFLGIVNEKDSSPLSNFMSFHNGSKFVFYDTLVDAFMLLFRSCNIARVKIARLLIIDKFQSLRIKLGILTLKSILSFVCFRQLLVPLQNKGLVRLYEIYSRPNNASRYFTKFVPVLQLLIGIQATNDEFSLKEFFAFEAAREIGIFDDFSRFEYKDENIEEKKKQMIFSFLYVSLLLVIERTLFNYNGINFMTEQIVCALKNGVHSIEKLNKLYDSECMTDWAHHWYFNDVLMDVATTTNKNENKEQSKSYNPKTSFYLKEEIEWKSISAINSINDQMTLMTNEITKDSNKLIQIPEFESEETYFFHPNPNDKIDSLEISKEVEKEEEENILINTDGLNIRLKKFLFTPTVLAIVYSTLRSNEKSIDLNDHLAMNILILIAKFVKEEEKLNKNLFNESTTIHYESIVDLISTLKRDIFNYHTDDSGNAFIENTLDQTSFVSLLKIKFETSNLPPKSFIDILLEKGKIGRSVLDQISRYIDLNINEIKDEGKQDMKSVNRERAKKLKADIMKNYKDMISSYNTLDQKGADSIDDTEKEVCSICSTYKEDEIYCYPVYLYRTKFPFIVDKPPSFDNDIPWDPIDDIMKDFDSNEEDEVPDEVDENEIKRLIMLNFPEFQQPPANEEESEQRRETYDLIYRSLYEQVERQLHKRQDQKAIYDLFKRNIEKSNKSIQEKRLMKRCTSGANFIIQFSMCMHPVHLKCCNHINNFTCPVDRSMKNCLLPCINSIPPSSLLKSFNNSEDEHNELLSSVIESIKKFIECFSSLFIRDSSFCITTELVKSISGLISTYEIRLRNISYCLDSEKNKLLPRNLFLSVWEANRFSLLPEIEEFDEENELKLTAFQLFVKRLIENENLEGDQKEAEFMEIVTSFIDSSDLNDSDDQKINEEKKFLFLRRVCLAEYFLIGIEVSKRDDSDDVVNWDEVLSLENLSKRYKWKFESIDNFEFKPFSFMKFPEQFLHFGKAPFKFDIEFTDKISLFDIFDYNNLINKYDELSGEIVQDEEEKMMVNEKNIVSCDNSSLNPLLNSFYGKKFYPSVLMFVSSYASQILLIDQSKVAFLDPFYIDKYGCADIGYQRGQPLFFNEEKYKRFIDTILSGDFAYQLQTLE
ncbi:hypothetical protein M9Y10_003297 [Tritrichomonas musculus]|uniref:E3 ubiquitin-protein ligase n=1 Tax=Tritrichomonas musculus TaxID=1915356 RepID=A0ABR2JPF0_9EUKA